MAPVERDRCSKIVLPAAGASDRAAELALGMIK